MTSSACLHDYQVVRETPSGTRERCKKCGKVSSFNKGKSGAMDERRFANEHARDLLQSWHPKTAKLYEKEYGKATPLPKGGESPAEALEEAREELKRLKRTFHGPS